MSVDVEIYLSNIIKFFKENPNDLLNLVPKEKEQLLYRKIREVSLENYQKGDDVSLTQTQLISVCSEINKYEEKVEEEISKNFVQKTQFGFIFLN
jgi:hypothetical protein